MITDPLCTCETIDCALAARCAHCRFEECDEFTYSLSNDAAYFDTPEEAIKAFRDGGDSYLVQQVEIFGYRKKQIDPKLYTSLPREVLCRLLEEVHEEYGNHDEDYTPCANMKQAAEDFVQLVLDHYKVWQCEPKPFASKIFTRSGTCMANGACLTCEKLSCVCNAPGVATDQELRDRLAQLEAFWVRSSPSARAGYRVDLEAYRRAVRGLK